MIRCSPTPCPKGRYCPGNTGYDQELCPLGTYGPTELLESRDECTQCDGGFYCGVAGDDNYTAPCYPGYWCNSGVDTPAPSNNNTGFGGLSSCSLGLIFVQCKECKDKLKCVSICSRCNVAQIQLVFTNNFFAH